MNKNENINFEIQITMYNQKLKYEISVKVNIESTWLLKSIFDQNSANFWDWNSDIKWNWNCIRRCEKINVFTLEHCEELTIDYNVRKRII